MFNWQPRTSRSSYQRISYDRKCQRGGNGGRVAQITERCAGEQVLRVVALMYTIHTSHSYHFQRPAFAHRKHPQTTTLTFPCRCCWGRSIVVDIVQTSLRSTNLSNFISFGWLSRARTSSCSESRSRSRAISFCTSSGRSRPRELSRSLATWSTSSSSPASSTR